MSRIDLDHQVQAKVYLMESELSAIIGHLESEGKDISAGYSKHAVAYQVDPIGAIVTRREARIDIPANPNAAGYSACRYMEKEIFMSRRKR